MHSQVLLQKKRKKHLPTLGFLAMISGNTIGEASLHMSGLSLAIAEVFNPRSSASTGAEYQSCIRFVSPKLLYSNGPFN